MIISGISYDNKEIYGLVSRSYRGQRDYYMVFKVVVGGSMVNSSIQGIKNEYPNTNANLGMSCNFMKIN